MKKGGGISILIICIGFLVQCTASHKASALQADTVPVKQRAAVKPTKGGCIGNSTVARYLGGAAVASLIFSQEEIRQGYSCHSLAVPGHTIYQQLALWNAYADKAKADWIIVEIDLNDLKPADPLDSVLYRYQKLIDTINLTKKPGATVILATMTPVLQRLKDVYKEKAMVSYKKWIGINNAIMGEGPNAITGVDYRFNGHTIALSDEKGNLRPEYEVLRQDHVHENTAGRLLVASYWRMALVKMNLLELGGR